MSEQAQAAENLRPYVFFDEQRPTREWMPTLEMINERLAQNVRSALLQYLQPPIEVAPELAIELLKHSELIDRLSAPSYLTVVDLKPLGGQILLAIEPELVDWIVESRFGGSGRLPGATANRDFTTIELHVMRRVVEIMLQQFATAWKPIGSFEPQFVRHEVKPEFATFAGSTDLVIVSRFTITVASGSGKVTIGIPYMLLEPMHDRLVSSIVERPAFYDERWSQSLRLSIGRAKTVLNVELAAIEMTVRDFLNLRPGSVFEIERPDIVTIQAHGQPLFRGRWGRHGRKVGVRIEERLEPSAETSLAAGSGGERGKEQ